MAEKRFRGIFLTALVVLVLVNSAFANHPATLTIQPSPGQTLPITVGSTFTVDVLLNLPSGSDNLYEAYLKFPDGNTFNFAPPSTEDKSSEIFSGGLTTNTLVGSGATLRWLIDGYAGSGLTLTAMPARLATIRLTATKAGSLDLGLDSAASARRLVQEENPLGGADHLYDITIANNVIIAGDPCENVVCQNGGSCQQGNCVCQSGFSGDSCEIVAPLTLTSPAVVGGQLVDPDDKYTCYVDGQSLQQVGVNPQLNVPSYPPTTAGFVLVMDDLDFTDSNTDEPFVHWVAWNILPPAAAAGVLVTENDAATSFLQGLTSFGNAGYGGPCPPDGATHNYRFRLYALDNTADLSGLTDQVSVKAEVFSALGVTETQTTGFSSPVLGLATLTAAYGNVPPPPCIPAPETCDGADNDCDGSIDEDFDLQTDLNNCGTCNNICSLDAECQGGQCVSAIDCGDGTCSPGETVENCPDDCPGGTDDDNDGVSNNDENPLCTSTPAGFTVANGKVYSAGIVAGCIIGDVNLDQQLNSNDISSFIFEYNHRTDGFEAAADLTQDDSLDSNDISAFIFSYNHRGD